MKAAVDDPGAPKTNLVKKLEVKQSAVQKKEDLALEPAEGDAVDVLKQKADAKIRQITKLEKVRTHLLKKINKVAAGGKWEDEPAADEATAPVAAKEAAAPKADEAAAVDANEKIIAKETATAEEQAAAPAPDPQTPAAAAGDVSKKAAEALAALDPSKAIPAGVLMRPSAAKAFVNNAKAALDLMPSNLKSGVEKAQEFSQLMQADVPG